MQNFRTLVQPLLGEKYVAHKRKKERKNNPENSGHFVLQQRLKAEHALRSDQKFDNFLSIVPDELNLDVLTPTACNLFTAAQSNSIIDQERKVKARRPGGA